MPSFMWHHLRRQGFTLIELAIVLVIVGVIIGIGSMGGRETLEMVKKTQAETKLRAIEQALLTYRTINNHLPCPADAALAESNASFGFSAASPGNCSSLARVNSGVAEGMVPFKELGLPSEFAYDAWNHRIAYAVSVLYTGADSFLNSAPDDSCTGITVNDASGNPRESAAVYALISYGPNGHGSRNRSGALVSSGSTNADERRNCNCDPSAANVAPYIPTYVQKDPVLSTSGSTDTFDDLVRYSTRWRMQTADERGDGLDVIVLDGTYNTYRMRCGVLQPVHTSNDFLGADITFGKQTSDNAWLIGGIQNGASGELKIFARNGLTYGPALSPPPVCAGVACLKSFDMSKNGKYIAIGRIYDGVSLRAADVYSRTGSALSALNFDIQPAGNDFADNVTLSGDGNFLVISAVDAMPAIRYLNIYRRDSVTSKYKKIVAPLVDDDGTNDGRFTALTTDGSLLALSTSTSGVFRIFQFNGAQYAQVGSDYTLAADIRGLYFSPDDRWLAVMLAGGTVQPYHVLPVNNLADNNLVAASTPALAVGDAMAASGTAAWDADARHLYTSGAEMFLRSGVNYGNHTDLVNSTNQRWQIIVKQ